MLWIFITSHFYQYYYYWTIHIHFVVCWHVSKDLFNNICYGHTTHKAHLCVDIVTYELAGTQQHFQIAPEKSFHGTSTHTDKHNSSGSGSGNEEKNVKGDMFNALLWMSLASAFKLLTFSPFLFEQHMHSDHYSQIHIHIHTHFFRNGFCRPLFVLVFIIRFCFVFFPSLFFWRQSHGKGNLWMVLNTHRQSLMSNKSFGWMWVTRWDSVAALLAKRRKNWNRTSDQHDCCKWSSFVCWFMFRYGFLPNRFVCFFFALLFLYHIHILSPPSICKSISGSIVLFAYYVYVIQALFSKRKTVIFLCEANWLWNTMCVRICIVLSM